jgi:hypothetical protein
MILRLRGLSFEAPRTEAPSSSDGILLLTAFIADIVRHHVYLFDEKKVAVTVVWVGHLDPTISFEKLYRWTCAV